jgi:hypothetical protein
MRKSKQEIYDLIGKAVDALEKGSKYPGLSYEEGIIAALDWVLGNGENPVDNIEDI